jgi:HK97 family phage major capsid protein
MDPEIRQIMEQVKAQLAEGNKLKGAVSQLEEQMKGLPATIESKLNAVRSVAWDAQGRYRGLLDSEDDARCFGLLVMAHAGKDGRAIEALKGEMKSVYERAMGGTTDTGSGLVPIEYARRIQRLVEDAGVWPANAFTMPMSTDQMTFQRRTQGLTVFKTGRNVAATASDLGFDTVNLNADEWNALAIYPKSLDADAAGALGELVMMEIVQAFAQSLDTVGFGGDGTPDSLDVFGIINRLLTINGVDDGGGLVLGSGNLWSELVLADFETAAGRLPGYAHGNAKWYASIPFFFGVMVKLMLAAGGVTAGEIEGKRRPLFLGYPVELVNYGMPKVQGNSQVPALFGDLRLSSTHGVREQLTIDQSGDVKFIERQVAVLGTQRHAVNNHSLGNATDAGAVVGVITQSS